MKRNCNSLLLVTAFTFLLSTACVKDLLDRRPTVELDENAFWQDLDDAEYALMGLYSSVRPLFDRDYYLDGHGEYVRTRGTSATNGNLRLGDAYQGANYNPTGYGGSFDKMYRYLYGGVNRANYVIENAEKMAAANPQLESDLQALIGEAKLLRGMVYFRLISLWGDVPYINKVVYGNAEVAMIERTPLAQVKDSILADFTAAFESLPDSPPAMGRAAKPAALAFRGKLNLYWASWNKNGWPELDTFVPNPSEADIAFAAAAEDFRHVIQDYGLTLFRNGEPGEIDTLGRAEILPNYYYLFTPVANGDPEIIMGFTHGGVGSNQGEELMRDIAGRSHEGSQCWVSPRFEIADRYQATITGDFVAPLIPMNPTTQGARTAPGSAINPES